MRRSIVPAAVAFAALVLAACSTDAKDFQQQGEKFIEGDEVRETMGGVRMSDAECDEPADTDEDTVYSCRATGSDDNIWTFRIEITGSTSLRIIAGEVAPSDVASASTAAPDSDPDSDPGSVESAASTTVAPTTSSTASTTTGAPTTTAA